MANLFVPIYSMRSYETDLYDLTKDGNFQLIMSRLQPGDGLVIPSNSIGIAEILSLGIINPYSIIAATYGKNAYETRQMFWSVNQKLIDNYVDSVGYDAIVTDITGYKGQHKFFCNFNISKDPDHPLSYIDEFIDSDVDSINRSIYTTVLNQRQIDYLVNEHSVNQEKLYLCQQVISEEIMDVYRKESHNYIDTDIEIMVDHPGIFFPFRLSDYCYKFEEVYKYALMMDIPLYITDPNQSFDKNKWPHATLLNNMNKHKYYSILMKQPTIIYHENPDRCFHPGLAELIYFKCNLISPYLEAFSKLTLDKLIVTSNIYEIPK